MKKFPIQSGSLFVQVEKVGREGKGIQLMYQNKINKN